MFNVDLEDLRDYKPSSLGWTTSKDEEIEELTNLIECEPIDVELLKQEFEALTGHAFRKVEQY